MHEYVRAHGWFDKVKPDVHLSMKRNRQLLPKSYVSIVVNDKSWLVNRWQCQEMKTELSTLDNRIFGGI